MAYKGTVNLASGLTQKNGLNFPIVNASAVYVSDDKRLDAALDGKSDTNHGHQIKDINQLQETLERIAASGGGGGGESIVYTVNGTLADSDGNFQITPELVGASEANHIHKIADVENLQTTLDGKSNTDHTHTMVTKLIVNEQDLTGDIHLTGTGNVEVRQNNENIDISITPYTESQTEAISDSAPNSNKLYKIFVGTEAQWNEFKETIPNDSHYLVFIRS